MSDAPSPAVPTPPVPPAWSAFVDDATLLTPDAAPTPRRPRPTPRCATAAPARSPCATPTCRCCAASPTRCGWC
ncbi:hypothetical protein [Nocardioides daphniae]|uniref:Uncharacterized protein n=1 Tax=Nocardioides daphniae TaxID=402297 RepID=A0A4P7UD74_9ACTN|nr:hypothetical protein [Nocardioides daphniae]QCC78212.1 hypothetical protein E2C04_15300 [Nocardioides daphniae]